MNLDIYNIYITVVQKYFYFHKKTCNDQCTYINTSNKKYNRENWTEYLYEIIKK